MNRYWSRLPSRETPAARAMRAVWASRYPYLGRKVSGGIFRIEISLEASKHVSHRSQIPEYIHGIIRAAVLEL